jgi:hypothetical protein
MYLEVEGRGGSARMDLDDRLHVSRSGGTGRLGPDGSDLLTRSSAKKQAKGRD